MKFEKIYDWDGEVRGYKLGDFYLMKHYHWGNNYSWIINKTGDTFYFGYEWDKAVRSGEVEMVLTCKQGKERLKELNA